MEKVAVLNSSPMDFHRLQTASFTIELKERARELGFVLSGVCRAETPPRAFERLEQWIELGYAGDMNYLSRRLAAYASPTQVLPAAKSILMLALPYPAHAQSPTPSGAGRVARYAQGERDYHDVIHERLKQLAAWVREHRPEIETRGVVDSAPLLERDFAQLAGLGWRGKNTLLLNRTWGSYFFLAALLLTAELPADQPFTADHCGSCTACLTACPTQAFPAPYVLDANRCLSYLTIEHRDAIPTDLATLTGDWVFGCDVCQEVCPWNRRTPDCEEPVFEPQPLLSPLELTQLFEWTDDMFRAHLRRTPLWRSKRAGMLRNAAIVLGNQRHRPATAVLQRAAATEEPSVRLACVWALERINEKAASGVPCENESQH